MGKQNQGPFGPRYQVVKNLRASRTSCYTVADQLFSAFGGVKLRQLRSRLAREDQSSVLDLTVDPRSYTSLEQFWVDWMAVNLVRKSHDLRVTIDTTKVAVEAFLAAEEQCRATNLRLRASYDTPTTRVSGDSLIEAARLKIARLLGPFDWNEAASLFGFSSGASTGRKRAQGDPWYKYQGKPDVTRRAALLAVCAISSVPHWDRMVREHSGLDPSNWVNVVSGNRLAFVAKNAKTKRSIAVEPCMNMHMQLGIGAVIRRRLRKVGVDLNDQTNNQRFAQLGSISDSFSTLDLAAASDTISYELVKRLMPPDWFDALDALRSPLAHLDAKTAAYFGTDVIRYQKFSSMGNGYTFELESLIFWALCSAVNDQYQDGSHPVLVYGDDIIVHKAVSGFVEELLSYCGFRLNADKSFSAGPFRESCGKHYFQGVDVTPIYIQEPLTGLSRIFWLINALRYWSARQLGDQCDPRIAPVLEYFERLIPRAMRLRVPSGFSLNAGIHSTFSEARPTRERGKRDMRKPCTRAWRIRYLQEGAGDRREVFDVYAYLRAMQGKPESQYGYGSGDVSLTTLVVNRQREWVRVQKTCHHSWSDAPLLVL